MIGGNCFERSNVGNVFLRQQISRRKIFVLNKNIKLTVRITSELWRAKDDEKEPLDETIIDILIGDHIWLLSSRHFLHHYI